MRKICLSVSLFLLAAAMASAQQVVTKTYVTDLTPSAEVPAITDLDASGHANVAIHLVYDANGTRTGAIVDFRVMWAFGAPVTIRAMHIHRGGAGVNGPVVIDSRFGPEVAAPVGSGTFIRSSGLLTDSMALETIDAIIDNPAGYYVNLHSQANPGGFMRGQLRPSDSMVLSEAADSLTDMADLAAAVEALQSQVEALEQRLQDALVNTQRIANRLGIVPR